MKILIAISSKEFSGPTLDVGMNISRALNATTTIVDVGEKINELSTKDISIANELMDAWNINRPGMDVLEWAYNYLIQNNFITENNNQRSFKDFILDESTSNRTEIHLDGAKIRKIYLILRNGDIITELREEVRIYNYDLTIIGGSSKRKLAHDFIQYIESSILIVNNFNLKKQYRILLAVNDSKGTPKAIKYGVRVAQAFNIEITLLTVSKNGKLEDNYKKALNRAKKMLRRCAIKSNSIVESGDPVEKILDVAKDDHIIIMGVSSQSPIAKFFTGSKPLNVIEKSKCPILIVK